MVFKRKGSFFLDLGSEGSKPVKLAIGGGQSAAQTPEASSPAEVSEFGAAAPVAPKGPFFLDLGSEGSKPVKLAIGEGQSAVQKPEASAQPPTDAGKFVASVAAAAPGEPAAASAPALTTAEAIAAELRAAQEARPATVQSTFAPDCLNPANAVPSSRRKAGANLAGFKAMAASMMGK